MTEEKDPASLPEAEAVPEKATKLPVVWIIPILAALVAVGIAVQRYLSEGPTVHITFRVADGVEAEKTVIKYKDVEIGKVEEVHLSDDYSKIVVKAKMEKSVTKLITEDARFWVVKPRVSMSGVSGLGTLLSGNFIGFEPGKSKTQKATFTGLETAPPVTTGLPGREIRLRAPSLGSLGVGSPVYFRHIKAGEVISFGLSPDGRSIDLLAFVNSPFDNQLGPNTRFWESSGFDVRLDSSGITLNSESVVSMLAGGLVFANPDEPLLDGTTSPDGVYRIYPDRVTAFAKPEEATQKYLLRFRESLQGLAVGAPVTMIGMPVGEVTEVGLDWDPESRSLQPRVVITTYLQRLLPRLTGKAKAAVRGNTSERLTSVKSMVEEKGLRAQLRTGNLLTGQKFVAIEYFPDAPKAKLDTTRTPVDFPVMGGALDDLATRAKSVMAKIERFPVDEIGADVRKAVASIDQAAKSADRTLTRVDGETLPEVKKTLASLDQTLQGVNRTVGKLDGEVVPEVKKTLEDLRRAVASAEKALKSADQTVLSPDAPAQQELRDAMQEVARAARAMRALADYLERNPESLIRGKAKE